MSGSHDSYYTSTSPKHSRNIPGEEDSDKQSSQGLPHLRDVLRGGFSLQTTSVTALNDTLENYSEQFEHHPSQISESSRQSFSSRGGSNHLNGPRLPPLREASPFPHYREPGGNDFPSGRPLYPHPSTRPGSPSSVSASRNPAYHVLVPSHDREELISVTESYTKPPGIVRDNILSSGLYDTDPKRKFECPVCGRRIERQSVYNQHMLTHTGERPFTCFVCPKAFNSKSNLNRHLLSHGRQGQEGEDSRSKSGESSSKKYYNPSTRT